MYVYTQDHPLSFLSFVDETIRNYKQHNYLSTSPANTLPEPAHGQCSFPSTENMKARRSITLAAATALAAIPVALCDITQGISPELFSRLDRMASLSMNVYTGALCGPPAGFSRAGFINETTYDIQGQVLRDDAAREAVVVFRGTASDKNFQVDLNVTLAPFEIAEGNCVGCLVHGGFYLAWAAAREQVLGLVRGVLGEFPGYGVVITGHRCVGFPLSLISIVQAAV